MKDNEIKMKYACVHKEEGRTITLKMCFKAIKKLELNYEF